MVNHHQEMVSHEYRFLRWLIFEPLLPIHQKMHLAAKIWGAFSAFLGKSDLNRD